MRRMKWPRRYGIGGACRRVCAVGLCVCGVLSIAACDDDGSAGVTSDVTASAGDALVTVAKGDLTPLVSGSSTVQVSAEFAVSASRHGMFIGDAEVGEYVHSGDALGAVDGEPIVAPVDGVVDAVSSDNDVAAGYPLVTMRYGGMSSQVDVTALLRALGPDAGLSGRFQVAGGQGPTDCAAVLPLTGTGTPDASDTASSGADGADATSQIVQCLMPKDTAARPGRNVTTVISADAQDDVLVLPVTAVAGREGKGQVNKRVGDGFEITDVTLGASDGTSIVITEGLEEGDQVSAVAPNLIPSQE